MLQEKEKKLLNKLAKSVIDGDDELAEKLAGKSLEMKIDPVIAIEDGLAEGLRVVGDSFGKGEAFLPDLVQAAEAMKTGLAILKCAVPKDQEVKNLGTVVIGTVEGDLHDIGKNIVTALLEANGFTVHDLGVNVVPAKFIEVIKESKPDIVAMSALLTTTLPRMSGVIKELKKAGLRDQIKVMVGGAPVTQDWAEKIGADAYGSDAVEAVVKAKELMGRSV